MRSALAEALPGGGPHTKIRIGRSRYGVISRYVAREFFFGAIVCFFFFFSVFFVNQILLMAEDILSKKAPFKDVMLLLLYSLPSVIAMSFPFASLVGALMAAGRLSSDSEMLAIMAAGIPPRRVFVPFLALGLCFAVVSFAMNDYYLPRGSIEFGKLSRKLVATTPALELKPWSSRRYKKVTVVTGEMEGGTIKGLLIFDRTEEGSERVISAGKASLSVDEKHEDVVLSLDDVWQQTTKKDEKNRFEWARAANMEYRISTREQGSMGSSLGPRDMPSVDLARVIAEKSSALGVQRSKRDEDLSSARAALVRAYDSELAGSSAWANSAERLGPALDAVRNFGTSQPNDRTLQVYRLEYFKKFSIPSGAFFFVILAFPLGLLAKRSGKAMGFGVGILIAVVYWSFLIGGDALGRKLGWSPFWSMWMPNSLVLAFGIALWAVRVLRKR
jgi:lipopolysaccharide export system permease protein